MVVTQLRLATYNRADLWVPWGKFWESCISKKPGLNVPVVLRHEGTEQAPWVPVTAPSITSSLEILGKSLAGFESKFTALKTKG